MLEKLRAKAEESRDAIISKRATLENSIDSDREALLKLPEKLKEQLGFNVEELHAKKWFPSLYAEQVDKDTYDEEKAQYLKEVVTPVVNLKSKLMKEAEDFLNENEG